MSSLITYDIIYNCILLDPQYTETWFDEKMQFIKKLTIVDISCDYSKSNNPIKLYNKATTWSKPAHKYNELVSIIAIENLPSLLPKECSDSFSSKFTDLLLDYKEDSKGIWQRAYKHFSNQCVLLPKIRANEKKS
jgi:saccharopine dehydrogenase (NAD+, L-lysine-forming)